MYNGLVVSHHNRFVKLSCTTYIERILEAHNWQKTTHKSPLASPMNHEKKYMRELETSQGPTDTIAHATLQKEMGFSYCQAIGEILFAAITYRPDILHCVINVSQYNTKPACIHYLAVKYDFRYLRDTTPNGLHYDTLPSTVRSSNHHDPASATIIMISSFHPKKTQPIDFVDFDWAGDILHRRSISGLCLCFAGAPVVYRARFQPAISQRSTDLEFIAVVEAGKLALYLRSMLDDLGIKQHESTPLYEDNATAIVMANTSRPTPPHTPYGHKTFRPFGLGSF